MSGRRGYKKCCGDERGATRETLRIKKKTAEGKELTLLKNEQGQVLGKKMN